MPVEHPAKYARCESKNARQNLCNDECFLYLVLVTITAFVDQGSKKNIYLAPTPLSASSIPSRKVVECSGLNDQILNKV